MAALSILLIVLLVIDIGLRLWQSGSELFKKRSRKSVYQKRGMLVI